jgi:hypothetical protein
MLPSDLVGGLGALALAVPAVKDQYYRFRRAREAAKESTSPAPKLRQILASAWEKRRNDYDGLDSLFTAVGALLILLSFTIKLAGS